jgi:arylformamidase
MQNRSVIDLTLPIMDDGSSPLNKQKPSFSPVRTFEKDQCRTTLITLYNHAGTHIDAPSHFFVNGPSVDKIRLEDLISSAWICDVSHVKYPKRIEIEDIGPIGEKISNGENIIFHTGWSHLFPKPSYYQGYPTVSKNLANWFVERQFKLIGTDTGSIASLDDWDELVEVHKILLQNNVIIIEGLTNLEKLPFNQKVDLVILPTKLIGVDGAPVRAIALI